MTTTLATRVALDRVAHFLYEEAALLDQRRWFDWMDLFAEGAMYWVPLTPDQPDPINHVSIFYEDAMMREVRARRLEEQRAWSQQPLVNAARIVGNIRLGEAERDCEILVRSTFIMAESRIPFHRQIAGFYYPGTDWGTAGGRVSVLITADTTDDLLVEARPKLSVRDTAGGGRVPLPDNGARRWKVAVGSDGVNRVLYRTQRWHRWRTREPTSSTPRPAATGCRSSTGRTSTWPDGSRRSSAVRW